MFSSLEWDEYSQKETSHEISPITVKNGESKKVQLEASGLH